MRTSALLCAKIVGFFEIYDCPHGQGEGVEPVRTFCGQWGEGGQFFAILCGRLLWTAPYNFRKLVKILAYLCKVFCIISILENKKNV